MKKVLVVLLALAMVFAMTTAVFATSSPSPTYVEPEVTPTNASDNSDDDVEVVVETLPYDDPANVEVRSAEDTEDLVEKLGVEDAVVAVLAGTGYALNDLTVLTPLDVTVKGNAAEVEWPVTVELNIAGVTLESTVVVLHKAESGWEVVPSKVVADGKVEATFNSLSPVVVLVANGDPSYAYNTCTKDENCPLNAYTDVDVNAWYHDYVHYVVDKNIMVGDGDTWMPQGSVKRGDFLTTLYRAAGSPAAEEASFSDLAEAADYMVPAINWAAAEGLVEGADGKILANDAISRQETFTILFRYAQKLGKVGEAYAVSLADFSDVADVADWALNAVNWGVASGLIEGANGALEPVRAITRASLATLLTRWETEIVK